MTNALTIDVEDYYHVSAFESIIKFEDWGRFESRVEKNTLKILELLNTFKIKATFFILGWIAERSPQMVKEIQKEGHEIACHGYRHQLVYEIGPERFREDITRSKRILEDIIGKEVIGYRAPSYSITKKSLWGLSILAEEGFKYDSSIFPIRHDRYGIPDFSRFSKKINLNGKGEILEIPLSTIQLFGKNIPIAGGGYLRLLPVRFIEWGIRSLNKKENQPAIIYFHPWEIDPEQPKLNGSRVSVFRHHVNIGKTFSKLKRLLNNFQFGPIREVFSAGFTAPVSFQ